MVEQLTLLAYTWEDQSITLTLLAIGTHFTDSSRRRSLSKDSSDRRPDALTRIEKPPVYILIFDSSF